MTRLIGLAYFATVVTVTIGWTAFLIWIITQALGGGW
jgi:hypothetical protein